MYSKSSKILLFLIIFNTNFVFCDSVDTANQAYDQSSSSPDIEDKLKGVVNKAHDAFDAGLSMGKGMAQSFGWQNPDYKYSYVAYNDASANVLVIEEQVAQVMGTNFKGRINDGGIYGLPPFSNTGDHFYDRQLFLTVWICADKNKEGITKYSKSIAKWAEYGAAAGAVAGMGLASPITAVLGAGVGALAASLKTVQQLKKYKIYNKDIYEWPKNDDKIYYYRTFSHKGKIQGEYLDLAGTTSAFSGQFYNNSKQPIPLEFTKDGNPYIVTLESDSFNLLESSRDVDYSIRPKSQDGVTTGFQFYTGSIQNKKKLAFIPISPDGIGNVVSTQKNPDKPVKRKDIVVVGPKLYTYEIYDTPEGPEVGIQGLKIGNFDQPTSGKIRDINPAECHIWYKSAATVQKELKKEKSKKKTNGTEGPDYTSIPFDIPEQVWINYATTDYVLQEKVPTGTVVDFYLMRPQLKEKKAYLYIVSLQTDDDKKAKKFLDRLNKGIIGEKAIYTDITKEDIDKKTILTMKPNINGFITDDKGNDASGVTGAILLADYFAPQGVGVGPFYYELDPGFLRIDQFANCVWFNTDLYKKGSTELKDNVMKTLSQELPKWVTQYRTDQDGARNALKSYLQKNANTGLFVDDTKPVAQREFTKQGKELYQTLINGPISLKNYPILRKAGMNWYTRTLGDKPKNWPEKSSKK